MLKNADTMREHTQENNDMLAAGETGSMAPANDGTGRGTAEGEAMQETAGESPAEDASADAPGGIAGGTKGGKGTKEPPKKSFRQRLDEYVNADEDIPLRLSLKALVGGDNLLVIVSRNKMLICVIVLFACVNVTLRYMMDNARMENDKYNRQLIDRQYKALSVESKLKGMMLSTHIEGILRDSTIHIPTEQSYSLKVPRE